MNRLILGTAGHIDHGKTALVRALTGIDTDRLPEEKQRGITIDLGFANLQLGDLRFGVVDVPGHEAFIRNMLAGATGMDAVLLVVAADEGVMPQTREHLAILDLLDVRSAVVAITKSDLVEGEWLQLVVDDVTQTLRPTSLRDAPVVPVSARSGDGLDALRAGIVQQALRQAGRRNDDIFRLPIDRIFTLHGTGTVVTGTVWGGSVTVDQVIAVRPAGIQARVRGIQVHGESVSQANAGERAALALRGVEKSALSRGDVVVGNGWVEARMFTVAARMIQDTDWTLTTRQRVHAHVGTAEVLARVVLLDAVELAAGASGWIQLRLEQPVIARAGDRVVLRSYSPVTTIGGGVIAEIAGTKQSRMAPELAGLLVQIVAGAPATSVAAVLARRGAQGSSPQELALLTPHGPPEISRALGELADDVVRIGHRVFGRGVVEASIRRVLEQLDRMHQEQPLRPALERAELRAACGGGEASLLEFAIAAAAERGELVVSGSTLKRAGFQPRLNERTRALRAAVLAALSDGALAAPTVSELEARLGESQLIRPLLRLLDAEGVVRAVAPELYIETRALAEAEDRTRRLLGGSMGLSAAEFRASLPLSRKHLIPLLEYFDRTGVTIRQGDLRAVQTASEADLPGAT
ncbi:MAG: selenocysteine-specific translation elongation factor [Gemmatimonadota bacterium]